MYRVKPQSLAVAQCARNPTLLVASTVAIVVAESLASKTAHCQNDSVIQAEADDLKEAVQEFADHVLQMADSPDDHKSSSSFSSSGRDRGHGSPFFSSMGHRSHHGGGGFGFRSSSDDNGGYRDHHSNDTSSSSLQRTDKFRGAYVEEPLVPALFYITVAGLTGSILARKSNFLFRFMSPVALAFGASAYCIPKTTNNLIHGLRTYDYTQWSHDLQHKYFHAKKSLVDTTTGLTSAAGSVVHGAQDTAHDLAEKTHELTDKTQHLLKDVKDKTTDVAHVIQEKGQDFVKEAHLGSDLGHRFEHAKDVAKDQVEDKAEHAKHWWNSEKKTAEKSAKEFSRAARHTGEDAKDSARSHGGFDRYDVERGFDRFKAKAHDGWENAREEVNDAYNNGRHSRVGRDAKRQFESWKDSAEDWAEDRSRDARGQFEKTKSGAQDWAEDRRRDAKWFGREAEDRFDDARHEVKKQGREARDFSEDRFRDARRDIRNRAEDVQDHGRGQFHKFERDVDDRVGRHGGNDGWGFGNSEDYGGRRGRYDEREEYGGRRGWNVDSGDGRPRRSVTEAAREGKHRWSSASPSSSSRHNNAADPYESYDHGDATNNRSSWWKTGSGPSVEDSARDQFDHVKHEVRRGADRLRDNVDDKLHEGHSWFTDKRHDLQNRFEQGKHDLHTKFAHDNQGRDMFGGGGHGHDHESIYSHDNWFHYDHGEDSRATAGGGGAGRRGRGERGM
ncbi:hypothetical protein BGX23_008806 [Mortierella sp. AD031]|nr:hypothetical protein BGX23_008806 [Mortierella sp. AD031]